MEWCVPFDILTEIPRFSVKMVSTPTQRGLNRSKIVVFGWHKPEDKRIPVAGLVQWLGLLTSIRIDYRIDYQT